jgi:hypothetical protein
MLWMWARKGCSASWSKRRAMACESERVELGRASRESLSELHMPIHMQSALADVFTWVLLELYFLNRKAPFSRP